MPWRRLARRCGETVEFAGTNCAELVFPSSTTASESARYGIAWRSIRVLMHPCVIRTRPKLEQRDPASGPEAKIIQCCKMTFACSAAFLVVTAVQAFCSKNPEPQSSLRPSAEGAENQIGL